MKRLLLLLVFLFQMALIYGQDNSFSFIENYKDPTRIKLLGDSLKSPLLVTENKIYAIGVDCINKFLDGTIEDRNKDGQIDKRNKEGDSNDRLVTGAISERKKDKGNNNRNKDGSDQDRNKDGDSNNRNKEGTANNRNNVGTVSTGPRCELKGNKILLYTRLELDPGKSSIYYLGNYFNQKYFKLIKL